MCRTVIQLSSLIITCFLLFCCSVESVLQPAALSLVTCVRMRASQASHQMAKNRNAACASCLCLGPVGGRAAAAAEALPWQARGGVAMRCSQHAPRPVAIIGMCEIKTAFRRVFSGLLVLHERLSQERTQAKCFRGLGWRQVRIQVV